MIGRCRRCKHRAMLINDLCKRCQKIIMRDR